MCAKIIYTNKHALEKHLSKSGVDGCGKMQTGERRRGEQSQSLLGGTVDSDVSLIGIHTCINIPLAFSKRRICA